ITPSQPSLSDLIDCVRSSIVQIQTEFGTGTGFLVGEEGYVITARHVVYQPATGPTPASTIAVLIRIPTTTTSPIILASFPGAPATVIDDDKTHDIAVLKMERNPFRGGARIEVFGRPI